MNITNEDILRLNLESIGLSTNAITLCGEKGYTKVSDILNLNPKDFFCIDDTNKTKTNICTEILIAMYRKNLKFNFEENTGWLLETIIELPLDTSIKDLGFTNDIISILLKNNINKLSELLSYTYSDLYTNLKVDKETLKIISVVLITHNLVIVGDYPSIENEKKKTLLSEILSKDTLELCNKKGYYKVEDICNLTRIDLIKFKLNDFAFHEITRMIHSLGIDFSLQVARKKWLKDEVKNHRYYDLEEFDFSTPMLDFLRNKKINYSNQLVELLEKNPLLALTEADIYDRFILCEIFDYKDTPDIIETKEFYDTNRKDFSLNKFPLNTSIQILTLSPTLEKYLTNNLKIKFIGDLLKYPEEYFLKFPHIKDFHLKEIKSKLKIFGFELKKQKIINQESNIEELELSQKCLNAYYEEGYIFIKDFTQGNIKEIIEVSIKNHDISLFAELLVSIYRADLKFKDEKNIGDYLNEFGILKEGINSSIDKLNLNEVETTFLKKNQIENIGDLLKYSCQDLLGLNGFYEVSNLDRINDALKYNAAYVLVGDIKNERLYTRK